MSLVIGLGNFSLPDLLTAAVSAARPADYPTEAAAKAAPMPVLAANQKGVLVTVTLNGVTNAFLKVGAVLLPVSAGDSFSMNWVTVTLAATVNGSRVIAQPIPVRPVRPPVVLYPFAQNVGTLEDSFYWSSDGGLSATLPTNGLYIPAAGDYLYVNPQSHPAHPSWLGSEVPAGDPITVIY